MKHVNIQVAKTHLSRLVEDVLAGEEVVIGKAGKPLVVLTPYALPVRNRKGGQLRGKIKETVRCWEADELADAIGETIYPVPHPRSAKVAEKSGS